MNVSTAVEAARVDALREAMAAELGKLTAIRSDRVADAFRAVPRHLFAAGEPLEAVYAADSALVTKRDEHALRSVWSPQRTSRPRCWNRPS